jgi:hypothetical protein
MTDDNYLHGPAAESARRRIAEYREKLGWDKDPMPYPVVPFALLVEILRDVHRAAENALLPGDDERYYVLEPWLLPIPKTNPAWAPEVLRTVGSFAYQGFDLPAGGVENLQRLFDAGREAEREEWNSVGSLTENTPGTLFDPTEDPRKMRDYWREKLGAGSVMPADIRPIQAAQYDATENAHEKYQCLNCRAAVYVGEQHHCPVDTPQGRKFRSFGDRRP